MPLSRKLTTKNKLMKENQQINFFCQRITRDPTKYIKICWEKWKNVT